jgi:Mn2+/Fe2+ NRAMP family transporter
MYWLNLFTWWLYISFILYFYKLNPFNPYPFYIGIVLRDILFIILNFGNSKPIASNTTFTSIFKLFMILLVHYIPLYYLYKSKKKQIDKKKNKKTKYCYFILCIFIITLSYLY